MRVVRFSLDTLILRALIILAGIQWPCGRWWFDDLRHNLRWKWDRFWYGGMVGNRWPRWYSASSISFACRTFLEVVNNLWDLRQFHTNVDTCVQEAWWYYSGSLFGSWYCVLKQWRIFVGFNGWRWVLENETNVWQRRQCCMLLNLWLKLILSMVRSLKPER